MRCLLFNLLLGSFVLVGGTYRSWDAILGARMGRAARTSLSAKLAPSFDPPYASGCEDRLSCESLTRDRVSGLSVVAFVITRRECWTSSWVAVSLRKLKCLSLKMRRRNRGMISICTMMMMKKNAGTRAKKGYVNLAPVVLSTRW
ncbi:uncharacterized protein EKO05_0010561 [Ascochyta rabiei]|uniref:uncharacterized protein n=1 Tax=Didymella rabiei TaxID=5454 RepID=UPI00220947A9|nr:uncharacterized protein EKO05_0010561 [Ascochyta rabiei]UPX20326.1 hypothetical protein EKO05_0010561 [Ascochyta rabiei]